MSTQNGKPPVEEQAGYRSAPGFVKARPENNAHYIAQWEGHDWHEIISWLDNQLEELIPGYNIVQIKDKFGLRYYFDYPAEIPVNEAWPAYNTVEKIKIMAEKRVTYAEGWVAGLETQKRKSIND